MRRALGFKLTTQGAHLMGFVGYCEARGADTVTTDLALAWATRPARQRHEAYWRRRLTAVRIFARHLQTLDPATEVPPRGRAAARQCADRRPTCIHRSEITALMSAAGTLAPAVAGGDLADADRPAGGDRHAQVARLPPRPRPTSTWTPGRWSIADSKFGKSRLVFLHPTTRRRAARLCAGPRPGVSRPGGADASSCPRRGTPAGRAQPHAHVRRRWSTAPASAPPGRRAARGCTTCGTRFTVATLLDWYRDGGDVAGPAPAAVHLARARRPEVHLLVLLRFPGYSDTRSLARVMGLWPGMTRSGDCRLSG